MFGPCPSSITIVYEEKITVKGTRHNEPRGAQFIPPIPKRPQRALLLFCDTSRKCIDAGTTRRAVERLRKKKGISFNRPFFTDMDTGTGRWSTFRKHYMSG